GIMYAYDYIDTGTPESTAKELLTLEIDGVSVTVPAGTSEIRAAPKHGNRHPKLIAASTVKAFRSWLICLLKIEGRKGYPASCTTTVAAGMKVRTQSEKLTQLRENVLELYVSDHPLECDTCPANGHCELQDVANTLGVTQSRYSIGGRTHQDAPQDLSNPYFAFNPDLCIVCSRCVRACDEVQGTFALTIDGRGFDSKVAASQAEPFLQSECVSCGACVEACPTAALIEKSVIELGQPERTVTTTCGYCGVGCTFKAEVKDQTVVRMAPNREGRANQGHACVKGRFAYGYATHPDRIVKPMIRKKITDPWQEVTWEEAINYAASEIKRIQAQYGKYSVGGITSSRCT